MNKISFLVTIHLFLFAFMSAHAQPLNPGYHKEQVANQPSLRNALTDVSLVQLKTPQQAITPPVYFTLLGEKENGRDVNTYHGTYHGKHVTAIVFLGLSALFLTAGIICIKASDGDVAGTLFSATGGTMGFLGFGIPGAIKLVRYPHNQPKLKE